MKSVLFFSLTCLLLIHHSPAQTLNSEQTNGGNSILLGKIDRSGLLGPNYKSWFEKNYSDYEPNSDAIKSVGSQLHSFEILVFMGTWCGDSKRQVPRFYKILDELDFPEEQLKVVALGRNNGLYKKSPQHEEEGLNIHRVPTFIFYKNGQEVNRIVEEPKTSLEEDIQRIVTNDNYQSNYQIVTTVDNILKSDGISGLRKAETSILKDYKSKVSSLYELNTYGRILFASNRHEEATAVFQLNTKLFPDEPRTYMSLANTLGVRGKKDNAIAVLETAIKISPNNPDLKENLKMIKSN